MENRSEWTEEIIYADKIEFVDLDMPGEYNLAITENANHEVLKVPIKDIFYMNDLIIIKHKK